MDIYELATLMHDKLCYYNHIDYCTWMYENEKSYPVTDKWLEAYAHIRWLHRARKTEEGCQLELETIAKVISAL